MGQCLDRGSEKRDGLTCGVCACYRDTFYDCEEGDATHDKFFRRPFRQIRIHGASMLLNMEQGNPCTGSRPRALTATREYVGDFPWRTVPEWTDSGVPPAGKGIAWSKGVGDGFQVRPMGYNAWSNPAKIDATGNLYDCIGLEFVRAEYQIKNIIGKHMEVERTGDWPYPLPRLLCINVQLPYRSGWPMFSHPEDDHGCSVVAFFQIKDSTLAMLQSENPPVCLKLFQEFVKGGTTLLPNASYEKSGLFKAIALCENVQEVASLVPRPFRAQAIAKNGKPALITSSGSVFRDPSGEWMEIGIDVRCFCHMARKMLVDLREHMSRTSLHIGFLIQGQGACNLPEGIIGDVHLHHGDILKDMKWLR